MHRIILLLLAALPVAAAAQSGKSGTAASVEEADITGLQAQMSDGSLSSLALTQAYLRRVDNIDRAGPKLNSIIELNPQAEHDAQALDAERRSGHVRGPLHGIPVLIKDNIAVAGMVNSAGSLALAEHRPAADAPLVARLRAAGAIILGKTNLSEWANFRSTHSTSGWSGRGGQTRNPYVLDRNPCGSSSGTGTAIAANLATVGVGTETDGSIICPSAVAGLVGIKPTVGMVSRSGVIPISASQDTPGPMARSVRDAAMLLSVMAGDDPNDQANTLPGKPAAPADLLAALRTDALRGARIGIVADNIGRQPDVDAAFRRATATLKSLGATLVPVKIPTAGQWGKPEYEVLLYEFKDGVNRYLADNRTQPRTLADLIAYNKAHAKTEMPWFKQEIFEQAQAKGPLTDAAYLKARDDARRLAGRDGIDAMMAAHSLDALIAPSGSPAWVTDHRGGDKEVFAGYGAAAVAGTPSVTVPMGDAKGLPLGLLFFGRAWDEPRLLGYAYAFEQATRYRRAPAYLKSVTIAGVRTPAALRKARKKR